MLITMINNMQYTYVCMCSLGIFYAAVKYHQEEPMSARRTRTVHGLLVPNILHSDLPGGHMTVRLAILSPC